MAKSATIWGQHRGSQADVRTYDRGLLCMKRKEKTTRQGGVAKRGSVRAQRGHYRSSVSVPTRPTTTLYDSANELSMIHGQAQLEPIMAAVCMLNCGAGCQPLPAAGGSGSRPAQCRTGQSTLVVAVQTQT